MRGDLLEYVRERLERIASVPSDQLEAVIRVEAQSIALRAATLHTLVAPAPTTRSSARDDVLARVLQARDNAIHDIDTTHPFQQYVRARELLMNVPIRDQSAIKASVTQAAGLLLVMLEQLEFHNL